MRLFLLLSVISFSMYANTGVPVDATSLTWNDGSNLSAGLTNANSIVARWTPSASLDLNIQIVRFYDDENCEGELLETTPPQTAALTNYTYSGPTLDGVTYSFSVAGVNYAGNEDQVPPCSPAITVDKTAPAAVTDGWWSAAPFSTLPTLTANWTATNENINGVDTQVF